MSHTESDWLPFTIGAVTATFAAMGAIAVAVSGILPAGHVLSDTPTQTARAAIVTPAPGHLTTVPVSSLAVSGTAGDLQVGETLWLIHQFPSSQQFTLDAAPLTVTDGTWSALDRTFEEARPGDTVNLHLLVAVPACATAIRAIPLSTTGRRVVAALPASCSPPVSEAGVRVGPATVPTGTDVR